jgi:hypothetical protein
MIKMKNLAPDARALVQGLMVGNVFYVGVNGDDNAGGDKFESRLKTVGAASKKLVTLNNDYVLCFGSGTETTSVTVSAANAHIIGASMPISDSMGRGYAWTCPATVDTIITGAAAHYLEVANIRFVCNATDHILIDNDAATDGFFHHNTVYGSTTASDAIRLDLEGARWTINDNSFVLCKLAIDVAGAACVICRNSIHDVDVAAKGIVIGANAHYCIVTDNIVNLSGGTGDVGITIASSADNTALINNMFPTGCSDNIADSGTATMMIDNKEAAITGTSTSSLQLFVVN